MLLAQTVNYIEHVDTTKSYITLYTTHLCWYHKLLYKSYRICWCKNYYIESVDKTNYYIEYVGITNYYIEYVATTNYYIK